MAGGEGKEDEENQADEEQNKTGRGGEDKMQVHEEETEEVNCVEEDAD